MKDRKYFIIIMICIAFFFLTTSTVFAEEYNIKFHINQPASESSYFYILATEFSQRVHNLSNGKVKVNIFPGGQLGKDTDVVEQIQMGSVEMGALAFPNMVQLYAPLDVFQLPYLFNDYASAVYSVNGPTANSIYDDFEEATNLKILGVFLGGFRGITNNVRPINSVDDFEGLKIRTPGAPVYVDTVEKLGASAITMGPGEVFTSLQQGMVDGQESTITWGFGQGFAEVQKYVTVTKHSVTVQAILVNLDYYNRLPNDIQQAISQAGKEAAAYTNGFNRMFDRSILDQYKAAGLEVTELDAEKIRPLFTDIWEDFSSKSGVDLQTIEQIAEDGNKVY